MKVIAAYMLAQLGGNADPSADDLKRILGSVGVEVDENRIELFLSQVKGKNMAQLVASGKEKLASVPSGGHDASVAAPPAVSAEIKEEKVDEEEEDNFDEPLFDLFGPDI